MLLTLADYIEQERRKKHGSTDMQTISFIKEGARPVAARSEAKSSLQQATGSWELTVDVGRKLQFPEVVHTALRPDILLWSNKDFQIILIELTVPWEEGCEEALKRKALKYTPLIQECKNKGWQVWLFPVEVGCKGFPAKSV